MTSELRPAVEVWRQATDQAMGSACGIVDCEECSTAAAVIEADREAVRAEVVREIAAWLWETDDDITGILCRMNDRSELTAMLQAKFGASHD